MFFVFVVYFLTAPAVCARPEQNNYQLQQTPSSAGASEGLALVRHRGKAWHVGEGEDGKVSSQVSDFQFEANGVISCITHSKPLCTGVVESHILFDIGIHARLHHSNTVSYECLHCAIGARNCEMIVRGITISSDYCYLTES